MAEEKAATFLRGLQIKAAAFGGFDKTETFTKFKELAYIYEDILAKERGERELEQIDVDKLRTSLAYKTSELEQLQEKLRRVEAEKADLEREVRESVNAYTQKERFSSSFELTARQDSDDLLRRAKNKSEEIISDARREAEGLLINARAERDSILKTAHDDALRRRADLQNEVSMLRNEKKTILTELEVIHDQLKDVIQTVDACALGE